MNYEEKTYMDRSYRRADLRAAAARDGICGCIIDPLISEKTPYIAIEAEHRHQMFGLTLVLVKLYKILLENSLFSTKKLLRFSLILPPYYSILALA